VFGVANGQLDTRPVARFQDFEVHLETGEVWKAGRPLKVQDQPFKVLAALLERPGRGRYAGRAASADLAGEELRGF
jgi:DNA-binding response OmpR family regulator